MVTIRFGALRHRAAIAFSFLILLIAALTGCSSLSTQKAFYEPIDRELRAGNYDSVVVSIETARAKHKYKKKDRFLYFMDAGMANHYASRFDTSNYKLTKAEDAADELFTKSISRAAASLMLNDNILEYAGEDYEVLYANLIKALNYISLDNFEDAFVEIKRANHKLELLEQKYRRAADVLNEGMENDSSRVDINYHADEVRFNNSAFARYLSMHLYAADGNYDDAQLDYDFLRRAFIEQPDIYPFKMPDVTYRPQSGAIVSVVALTGPGPVKEPLNLRLRTDKDLNLVQILYDSPGMKNAEYNHIPMKITQDYYFKFALPQIVLPPSHIDRISVSIDGEYVGDLNVIEDIGAVAKETFRAKKSLIYLRTIARAIAKGLIAHKAKKKADTGGLGGWLKKFAIDAVTDISENADLRCCRLLPGKVSVADFELSPGTHDIVIAFINSEGIVLKTTKYSNYKVLESGLNMLEAVSLN